jgi:hypothetical protein
MESWVPAVVTVLNPWAWAILGLIVLVRARSGFVDWEREAYVEFERWAVILIFLMLFLSHGRPTLRIALVFAALLAFAVAWLWYSRRHRIALDYWWQQALAFALLGYGLGVVSYRAYLKYK